MPTLIDSAVQRIPRRALDEIEDNIASGKRGFISDMILPLNEILLFRQERINQLTAQCKRFEEENKLLHERHSFDNKALEKAREYEDRLIKLLIELHDDEVLTESQCAKYLGEDILGWRIISNPMSHAFEQEPTGED